MCTLLTSCNPCLWMECILESPWKKIFWVLENPGNSSLHVLERSILMSVRTLALLWPLVRKMPVWNTCCGTSSVIITHSDDLRASVKFFSFFVVVLLKLLLLHSFLTTSSWCLAGILITTRFSVIRQHVCILCSPCELMNGNKCRSRFVFNESWR